MEISKMTQRKLIISLILLFCIAAIPAYSQHNRVQDGSRYLEELNERDFEALRQYLKSKREEEEKKGAKIPVLLSGDVRFEYRNLHEKEEGHRLRGGRHANKCIAGHRIGLPISNNDFDVEANLRLDYKGKCSWAVVHIQYDNSAGVDDGDIDCPFDPIGYHGSGICDDLCLKKAFWGMHLYEDGCERFDIELGRRNLYNLFDSRVQFLSRFDGVALKYNNCWDCLGDFYWYAAGFVVDERVNHFAWITEVGLLNIAKAGFDIKYSIIDWQKFGRNRCHACNPQGFKFLNSQVTLGYNFKPEFLGVKARAFGAFVYNHKGQRMHYINFHPKNKVCRTASDAIVSKGCHEKTPKHLHKKTAHDQNKAWYVGVLLGEVRKRGDWSFEARYEWVQAFSIPDNDLSGIGRGNTLDDQITAVGARGNTNYKGWKFEGLYAITDELSVDTIFEYSQQLNKTIGGTHHYSKLEVETIFAF